MWGGGQRGTQRSVGYPGAADRYTDVALYCAWAGGGGGGGGGEGAGRALSQRLLQRLEVEHHKIKLGGWVWRQCSPMTAGSTISASSRNLSDNTRGVAARSGGKGRISDSSANMGQGWQHSSWPFERMVRSPPGGSPCRGRSGLADGWVDGGLQAPTAP